MSRSVTSVSVFALRPLLHRRSTRRRIPRRAVLLLGFLGGVAPVVRGSYLYNANDFAVQVVSSTGLNATSTYDNPNAVLGAPSTYFNNSFNPNVKDLHRAKLIEPAFNTGPLGEKLLTKITAGTQVTVKMGRPIAHDPSHPFGEDLIIFGNSFFSGSGGGLVSDSTNLNTFRLGSGAFGHGVVVSVSPDDVNWFTYTLAQPVFPTNSFVWNSSSAAWTNELMDPTRPLDPSLTLHSFSGLSAATALSMYGGSAGGTGINLAQSGFSSIQYVRLQSTSTDYAVIDAIAAVSSVPEPGGVGLAAVGLVALLFAPRPPRLSHLWPTADVEPPSAFSLLKLETLMKTARRSAGITLPELLICIAILILLVALLLPVLSHARNVARQVTCLANLRQMAQAATAYATDNDGRFPPAYFYSFEGVATTAECWDISTVSRPGEADIARPGLLWQGLTSAEVQQCPAFDGGANWLVDPFTGYNYNTSFVGHGQFETIALPARISNMLRPSRTALFGDGQYYAGADKFMRTPWPNPADDGFSGRWAGTQGYRHLGRTNVVFCDGHGESLSDRFTANADGATGVADGTGFLSADNGLYGGD